MNTSSNISLRDYQQASLDAVSQKRKQGITRPLVVLPTGTGKTIVFASIIKQLRGKALVIAHRDELLRQAEDKIKMVWPEAKTGIVKAQENDYQDKDVVIASIQTLSRGNRLAQIAPEGFNLCVIDEAHHGVSKSYRDTINYLGFLDDDPGKLLLGVTATTKRLDKLGLRNIFQEIVYECSILTMVKGGYLSDIRGFREDTGTDLTAIRTVNGDFVESELSFAVNTPDRNTAVVESYLEHADGRKALAFTAGIDHAHDLAGVFQSHGVEAVAISGKTSNSERKEILAAFSAGSIRVLCNCALLTEGYDEPSISCILLTRPTKSGTLFTQMVGRGTRKHPGKQDCIVIDFADNRHDVCALPTLFGLSIEDMAAGESLREELERGEGDQQDINKSIGRLEEFDLLGKSNFIWIDAGGQWLLPITPDLRGVLVPEGGKFKTMLIEKGISARLLHPYALELGYAQGIVEDYARRIDQGGFCKKDAPWRSSQASDKQVTLLVKLGINPKGMNKGDASIAIDRFFAKKNTQISYGGLADHS